MHRPVPLAALLLGLWFALLGPLQAAEEVRVGAYLNNVESIDLASNTYYVNAYLWLRWRGQIDPTAHLNWLNLNDAWALTLDPYYPEPLTLADGSHYQRYYIEAKFFHKFWLGTFPLDWQKVLVELELRGLEREQVRFVPDTEQSAMNPDLRIPGWRILEFYNEERGVRYPGAFGLDEAGGQEYSRYRFGLKIERPMSFYLFKIIPPILIVLLSCIVIFLVDPSYIDLRIGTPIGALLTEVFLYLSFVAPLPSVGMLLLLDHVFNFCYLITFLVLLVAIWTSRLQGRLERLEGESEEAQNLAWSIQQLDRWALFGFPLLLVSGIFLITWAVRGSYLFSM